MSHERGATITELMVATAVLSASVIGLMGSFTGIQKVVQGSKSTTLASTLAQEQMQILKQRVYYQILITTNPAYDPGFVPAVEYDPGYFPAQTILEGGVNYTRYTLVEVVKEDSGAIVLLPPGTPDTGMKLVTVNVVWRIAGSPKKLTLRTIVANPDTVTANAIFSGLVRNAMTLAPIPGAVLNVAENLGWRDTSGATGLYSINLSPGNFTLGTVVPGYFPVHRSVSIAGNQSQTQDFDLVPMSSGTAIGAPLWINPAPVISQVVVSTLQADTNIEAQYVELYNPTAAPIVVGSGITPSTLKLKMTSGCSGAGSVTCAGSTYGIKLDYVNTTIPAFGYYLIANISTFTVNGVLKTADAVIADDAAAYCASPPLPAYWNPLAPTKLKKLAPNGHAATFYLTDASDQILDAVGWDHGGTVSSYCETSCIPFAGGAPSGQQFVRLTSTGPTAAGFSLYGRAYDSNANRVDFTTTSAGLVYPAYSSADGAKTLMSGKPAVGAIVSASDGLSQSTQSYAVGSPPYAAFALTQVATGTWTMLISSGSWSLQHDTVTIAATGSVFTLASTMSFLNTANADGFISGTVTNVLGTPISPAIPLDPGGAGAVKYASVSNGRYLLRVTPGSVDVVANSGVGSAANYVSGSSLAVTATLGGIHSGVDFLLSQGGRVSGFITRDGVNPLPGIAVSLIDVNGYSRDQPVSGSDGRFTSLNVATGAYTLEPALDSLESAVPASAAVTVTSGGNIFASTFTVAGALGAITGSVSLTGAPLRTGALIIVTTAALPGTPPAPPTLDASALTGSPYYLTSSQEDGTYRIEVRQSTAPAYRVYAYYTTYNGGTPVINSLSLTGVQVLAGQTVPGNNFAW
jgi:hypothetical protein